MKLGFVFDTKFTKFNNDFYSTNLSTELLEKHYLSIFDEMVIVGRYIETNKDPLGKLAKANNDKIDFKGFKHESPLKRIIHFNRESKFIEKVLSDCDAVICRGWRGTRICRKLKKNYLVEVVNCAWDSYWNHGWLGKLVAPIMYFIRRSSTKKAPYVIYVTSEFLQHRYPTNGKSAAISDVTLQKHDEDILRKRLDKINNKDKNEKIIIGTAAAVDVKFKGQRFVISALAKLKSKGFDNFEYQIAGKGDNRKLKELAKAKGVSDNVVFMGSIVHDKMFDWFDSLDIYIQPSLQEGLPRAVIEAMSRGLPCYGTKTGGIPELLDDECICSRNIFIDSKLAKFLETHTKEKAIKLANNNFYESKKYERETLEINRLSFLKEFSNNKIGDWNAREKNK